MVLPYTLRNSISGFLLLHIQQTNEDHNILTNLAPYSCLSRETSSVMCHRSGWTQQPPVQATSAAQCSGYSDCLPHSPDSQLALGSACSGAQLLPGLWPRCLWQCSGHPGHSRPPPVTPSMRITPTWLAHSCLWLVSPLSWHMNTCTLSYAGPLFRVTCHRFV